MVGQNISKIIALNAIPFHQFSQLELTQPTTIEISILHMLIAS
jgi:hypothetical protein